MVYPDNFHDLRIFGNLEGKMKIDELEQLLTVAEKSGSISSELIVKLGIWFAEVNESTANSIRLDKFDEKVLKTVRCNEKLGNTLEKEMKYVASEKNRLSDEWVRIQKEGKRLIKEGGELEEAERSKVDFGLWLSEMQNFNKRFENVFTSWEKVITSWEICINDGSEVLLEWEKYKLELNNLSMERKQLIGDSSDIFGKLKIWYESRDDIMKKQEKLFLKIDDLISRGEQGATTITDLQTTHQEIILTQRELSKNLEQLDSKNVNIIQDLSNTYGKLERSITLQSISLLKCGKILVNLQ